MGCLLYITITVVIMASGPWKKPQSFYLKYEPSHIAHEIEELQEELAYLNKLKKELGMVEEQTIATRNALRSLQPLIVFCPAKSLHGGVYQ